MTVLVTIRGDWRSDRSCYWTSNWTSDWRMSDWTSDWNNCYTNSHTYSHSNTQCFPVTVTESIFMVMDIYTFRWLESPSFLSLERLVVQNACVVCHQAHWTLTSKSHLSSQLVGQWCGKPQLFGACHLLLKTNRHFWMQKVSNWWNSMCHTPPTPKWPLMNNTKLRIWRDRHVFKRENCNTLTSEKIISDQAVF